MNIWASSQAIYCTLKMAVHTRLLVNNITHQFSSVQSFSRVRLFVTLWISMPGFPVYHQLPESTQTHVHRVGDAIQSSHPLSSPSPPAPNPSQHQSFPMSQLFAWGGQSIGVSALASVFPMNTQDWSPLGWTGWTSLQSKGLSRVYKSVILEWVVISSPRDLPNSGIEPRSPALQVDSLPAELPGKPHNTHKYIIHAIVIAHLGSTSLLYSSPFILTGFGILISNVTLYSPLVLDKK